MEKNLPIRRLHLGFTLIELLVTLALLGILVALLLPAVMSSLRKGDTTQRLASLREVGTAIHLFAADNAGMLPGPLWPGQIPVYDPARDGRLAGVLAHYLGIANQAAPATVELLLPRSLDRARPAGVADADFRTYVMNMNVQGRDGVWFNPWGSLAAGSRAPQPIARVAAENARVWGFSEADRTHPRVATAAWRANTIAAPLPPRGRLAWFFDGSVNYLPNDLIQSP